MRLNASQCEQARCPLSLGSCAKPVDARDESTVRINRAVLTVAEDSHAATLHKFRNEQMTPRGLRLSFCREEKGYIGNIWAARHNRYQMLLWV